MTPPVRVTGLDHIVLVTPDVERSLAFYTSVLGLAAERVDAWRAGEVPFPSVRIDESTLIDLFAGERTGENLAHVCLVVESTDLAALAEDPRLAPVTGPVEGLFGARGYAASVYAQDPDGNTIELRCY
ncbi:MAG: VOC family virulence protein [Actinomycetales bacterium]|nr:VOC family virulence protein [Actinomycetales bacterium]